MEGVVCGVWCVVCCVLVWWCGGECIGVWWVVGGKWRGVLGWWCSVVLGVWSACVWCIGGV